MVEDWLGKLCPECFEEMLSRYDALEGREEYCSNCKIVYRGDLVIHL